MDARRIEKPAQRGSKESRQGGDCEDANNDDLGQDRPVPVHGALANRGKCSKGKREKKMNYKCKIYHQSALTPSMNFLNAQQEFQIRYYQWATAEWEKQIDQSFPDLRLFQTGAAWKTFRFMQRLNRDKQLLLAHSLVKRFHPEAVKVLRETCSGQENSLRYGFDEFRRNPSGLDVEIIAENHPKERAKFLGKRKLLNKIAQKFQDAFSGQCSESERVLEGDPQLEFKTASSGWYIFTHFWFGRREGLIDYSHAIANEAFVVGSMMSFCSWLGISSQTQWESLSDDNVDSACDAAIKFCGRFFEVAPKLLKGLEFDKITSE